MTDPLISNVEPEKRARKTHDFRREAHDHYAEPPWCSNRLLQVEQFEGTITDPCCGFGHIMESAKARGYEIDPRDVVNRGWPGTRVENFLAVTEPVRNIVFNSPYAELAKEEVHEFRRTTPLAPAVARDIGNVKKIDLLEVFTTHAVRLAPKVAQFAPLARLNAAHDWLKKLPLARVWLLTPRPSVPPGSYLAAGKKAQGGRVDFCWLVFERGFQGRPTVGWLHRDEIPTRLPRPVTIASILPVLADRAGIDWNLPVSKWSKDQMVGFLSLAEELRGATR
jgi:hypothetical protein